jgi:putative lipoprotein
MLERKAKILILAGIAFFAPIPIIAQEASPPESHRMPMAHKFSYACDGGATVVVYLRETNARVIFGDRSYLMKQVEAASGTRYSDGTVVWWSKGYDGFLEDAANPGQPVMLAGNCKQVSPPPASASSTIAGTVAYRERVALPENAVLTVRLEDVSAADAPAKIIAEQKLALAGRQVPLPFQLAYDARKIDPNHTYAISARITVDGQLRFLNTTAFRVLTGGSPSRVDILVRPAATPSN